MMIGARRSGAGGLAGYEVLKVETHLHSVHSDGAAGVAAMFAACQAVGYQAVALTDHNTTSGLDEAHRAAAALGLIALDGVEVTTFRGHIVALGLACVPEWRDLDQRGIDALAQDIRQAGGVVCVAHPSRLGSPLCSGCAWDWPIDPRLIDLWEVFSAPQPQAPHPEVSLGLWWAQVAAGAYAAPVAAGDVHAVAAAQAERAATYVYVAERSPAGVLEALRARRLFASRGPRLDFWLEAGEQVALPGSCVGPAAWRAVTEPAGALVETVATPDGTCRYAVLRAADGTLEAISAPIWIETSQRSETSV
jgi:hypothetical protein